MPAPLPEQTCGCSTTKGSERVAGHVEYRRRVSPELSANLFYGPGNRRVRRTALESQRWRGRAILPGAKANRSERVRGNGGHRLFTLVREVTGRVGFRGVDWRCGGDQENARAQTEDRSPGRPTFTEVAAGKSLSANLDTESGESGSAATALAPASAGADADADHESAAGRGDERRLSLEEKAVQRKGTSTARKTLVGSLGQSASEGIIGVAGPAGSKDCGVNGSSRARSQETTRGAAVEESPWRGAHYGAGLRFDYWDAGAVSLWQADWQLHGAHSVRGLQCRPATAGTHQQAGQYSTALFAGRSIASSCTAQPGLATSVCTPDDAAGKKNCQSGHGQKTRCSVVLDVAKQLAIFAVG